MTRGDGLPRQRYLVAALVPAALVLLLMPSPLRAAEPAVLLQLTQRPAETAPDTAVDTIRELESQGPVGPGEPDATRPLRPKEKTKERLHKLEEQREKSRATEQEQQSPQERAREKVQQLEQTAPVEQGLERLRELDLDALEQEAGSDDTLRQRLELRQRVRFLLGVYENRVGIYDEILDLTKMGPGILHRALAAPRWLILGGEQRTRYEGLDGSWRLNEPNGSQALSTRTRLQIGIQQIMDPLRFLIEIQDSRLPISTTGAHINSHHANQLDIQQLHADLFSNNFLGTGIPTIVKVGRINMDLGRGRWVARNQFRNVTNAFDGVEWQLGDERHWHIRSFLVQPVQRFVRRLDPWAPNADSTFWGTYAESRVRPWFETTLHYYGHSSNGPGRDFNMLGGRVRKEPLPGELDYEIESSYQFGNITPQIGTAHFQHGEIGYTFAMPWSPQALFKFDYASNGFDVLYGRRSFELHPTGIFGPFQRSNMASPGARLLVKPIDRTYLFVQYRAWWLVDDSGPWAGTVMQDPTGRSGNFVGQTLELRARWGLDDNVWFQAGYAHFAFGPFAERAPGTAVTRDAHYGYIWTEFMF